MLKRFDHVTVVVRDLDGARRFFALLGFHEERAVVIAGAPFDRYMGVDGIEADHVTLVHESASPRLEVQLLRYRQPSPFTGGDASERLDALGWNHVCFAVDDVDAALARLAEAGVRPKSGVLDFHDRKLAFLSGPEGITVELAEWRSCPPSSGAARMHVLVYGDSLAWGIVPGTRCRLPFRERWPGALEGHLRAAGADVRVTEDCLNGRRTVWEDPFKPGRNGLGGLAQRIEVNSPVDLVVLALGTNDFQSMHPHDAWMSGQGVATLVRAIRTAPMEPGMPVPDILIVAPPPIAEPRGAIAPKFRGGDSKSTGLAQAMARVADEEGCHFFDSGAVVRASDVDGVHLDAAAHAELARTLAEVVARLLAQGESRTR